eukprot:2566872-Prymnesium_polylepis.1
MADGSEWNRIGVLHRSALEAEHAHTSQTRAEAQCVRAWSARNRGANQRNRRHRMAKPLQSETVASMCASL